MNVGRLNKLVNIERLKYPPARGRTGEPIKEWQLLDKRWASIEPLSGRERFLAEQTQSDVSVRIRIRYLEGLKASDRIVYQGIVAYDIVAIINPREKNEELELMCKYGVTDG